MRGRYFHGWNVVGATSVMALGSFGLGFYGIAVYVAMLQQRHGWSASLVSAPVTVYYVAGALLTVWIGDVYARLGPRSSWRPAAWPWRPASWPSVSSESRGSSIRAFSSWRWAGAR